MRIEKHTTDGAANSRAFHRVAALFAGVLFLSMFSCAQPPRRGNGQRPPGDRPDPAEMAKKLMEDFDADQTGSLSLEELTASLRALEQRRPKGPPPGGAGER